MPLIQDCATNITSYHRRHYNIWTSLFGSIQTFKPIQLTHKTLIPYYEKVTLSLLYSKLAQWIRLLYLHIPNYFVRIERGFCCAMQTIPDWINATRKCALLKISFVHFFFIFSSFYFFFHFFLSLLFLNIINTASSPRRDLKVCYMKISLAYSTFDTFPCSHSCLHSYSLQFSFAISQD